MAYYAMSPCVCCRKVFTYNPHRVPSTRAFTNEREPVCGPCMDKINANRKEQGLDPHEILPGAYEPVAEGLEDD